VSQCLYNNDDTVHAVTDARGASATYTYNNNRGLVNGINYNAPSGLTATANVSFVYDAIGNRTSMTDGFGSMTYQYNQLSQLTSETRQI
jgi:YD repeat-containing protein